MASIHRHPSQPTPFYSQARQMRMRVQQRRLHRQLQCAIRIAPHGITPHRYRGGCSACDAIQGRLQMASIHRHPSQPTPFYSQARQMRMRVQQRRLHRQLQCAIRIQRMYKRRLTLNLTKKQSNGVGLGSGHSPAARERDALVRVSPCQADRWRR